MRIGLFLSCEEYSPDELLAQARRAAQSGFSGYWISDHFHPWLDEQGQSPFVWSMIGALTQVADLPVTTAVTCPTGRIHPAVIAQAAATSAVLTHGRFVLGVGSGEALNESIMGGVWPPAGIRQKMLEEAIELMRKLWSGEAITHSGEYYTTHHARIYTLPEKPPPVYVSGFGPKATRLAARIGDGYVSTRPSADLVSLFRSSGGAGKPVAGGAKACYARDVAEARKIAHERWRTSGLPGELAQVLATPEHFDQASQLVTPDMIAKEIVCGADVSAHVDQVRTYQEAGFDELYVAPVGPHYLEMIDMYAAEILPEFA
jgi:G6PDH family F420-dependent oxidoreductase